MSTYLCSHNGSKQIYLHSSLVQQDAAEAYAETRNLKDGDIVDIECLDDVVIEPRRRKYRIKRVVLFQSVELA